MTEQELNKKLKITKKYLLYFNNIQYNRVEIEAENQFDAETKFYDNELYAQKELIESYDDYLDVTSILELDDDGNEIQVEI